MTKKQNTHNYIIALILVVAIVLIAAVIFQPSSTGNFRRRPAPSAALCRDSDHGANIAVKGTCSSGVHQRTDYCLNNDTLVEYYCGGQECIDKVYTCTAYGYGACENGACVALNQTNLTATGNITNATQGIPGLIDIPGNGTNTSNMTMGNTSNFTGLPGLIDIPNNGTNVSLPDLTIISLTADVANVSNQTNSTVTVTALVKNRGTAAASKFTTEFRILSLQNFVLTNYLSPGNVATLQTVYSLPSGLHTVIVTADANSQVEESDETNNQATLNFAV